MPLPYKRDDLDALVVKSGDAITAARENAVLAAIRCRTMRGGPGVRVRQLDTCQMVSYVAPPATVVSHAWKPSMTRDASNGPAVIFARGLINGIEPMIGEYALSDPAALPLSLPGYDDALGDCLIYAELSLDPTSWNVTSAVMAAYKTPPAGKPFVARKLIAIANKDGSVEPRAFFDLGFASSNHRSTGTFTAWWWMLGLTASST